MSVFCVMVTCLLGFHTYLALSNRTTCERYLGETASWEKISYLKVWPEQLGSPFSAGCLGNLRAYCCPAADGALTEWKMPERLPKSFVQRHTMC